MWKYLFRRLTALLPTLGVIILIGFTLNQCAPGDPVLTYLGKVDPTQPADENDKITESNYSRTRQQLGLDKPLFYFTLNAFSQPDTLHRFVTKADRDALAQLANEYGNWPEIEAYYQQWLSFEQTLAGITFPASLFEERLTLKDAAHRYRAEPDLSVIKIQLKVLDSCAAKDPVLLAKPIAQLKAIRQSIATIEQTATPWKSWVPTLNWYGADNQFHHWLIGCFQLDFGKSFINKQDVGTKIWSHLPWTICLSLISIFFAYVISIPLGVYSARHKNSFWDRFSTVGVFMLYSLPSFWVAILLMTWFANPEYFGWFPPTGVKSITNDGTWPFFKSLLDYAHHLVLPTICYTYASFAFLSRQVRSGMLEIMNADFIRTARAKGLAEKAIVWRHGFRNTLIPLLTMFAGIFPAMVGGSIILESIYSIPGMGSLLIDSIYLKDYPTISAIFLLTGVLTILGMLISDLLLAVADPRISLAKK